MRQKEEINEKPVEGIFERTWPVIKDWMKDEDKAKYNFRVSCLNDWEDDITNLNKRNGRNGKGVGNQYLAISTILWARAGHELPVP